MKPALVGLGNPGPEYLLTRHNVGFMFADFVARRHDLEWVEYPTVALAEHRDFYVLKPLLYMNNSGKALLGAPIPVSKLPLIVAYDDADLPFGKVRFRIGIRSMPSHKGLRDIYLRLRREDIMRLRFGIGRPPEGISMAEWVLSPFSEEELEELPAILAKAYEAFRLIIRGKYDLVGRVLS
ncbi:MAG: aminoacyl-tRNA hydrolase [Thermotogae bacterium]|nr:aminoacyl-tRNA hydrolase [Thermotogota bacterium]